jgi:hypothetical protein
MEMIEIVPALEEILDDIDARAETMKVEVLSYI